jgi:hypothetical protein
MALPTAEERRPSDVQSSWLPAVQVHHGSYLFSVEVEMVP